MKKPENYQGLATFPVPPGYIDVTSMSDTGRRGIPGPAHPYYLMRARVRQALVERLEDVVQEKHFDALADAVMEAL